MKKKSVRQLTSSVRVLQDECANPWNGTCDNTDIALYIRDDERRLPICRICWKEIADTSMEWGDRYVFP